MGWKLTVVATFALVALALAAGARAEPSRSFVVALTPAGAAPGWRADALTAALVQDLADDRLVFQPTALAACAPGCSDATLRGAGVELIVRGEVDADGLRYRLVPLWAGAPAPVTGEIRFGRVDRVELAAALRDRLHTIVRARADERAGADATLAPPDATGVAFALAGAALVLALPFAIGGWRGRARAARIVRMPALRRTALGLVAVGAVGLAIAALGVTGPWFAAGGLAWGALIVVAAPLVFPPLVGLGRVEHHELGRVLRAWLVVAALRTLVIAAAFAAVAIATWFACAALELDPALRGVVAVPLVALLAWHAWRCAIAVAALAHDDVRVAATPDADAWHDAVRAYLIGYLRRSGLPVDAPLLAGVRFLPGTGDEVAIYGGGLTELRVVIPQKLLESALSPWGRPHDYAAPRVSTLHWTQWNAGLVMATEPGAPVATPAQRQPRAATVGVGVDGSGDGVVERELLGEPPTLAGIIEPAALDPRDSYRPHDDPMWLDWDPGLAYDGTDAGDRDFLFGLIVHGLGEMQRRDLLFGRLRGRAPQALGDLHAALGGARHHLVQYLGWRLWQRDDLLTARAYAPELEAASRRVLGVLAETPAGDPRLRRRLAALGALVVGAAPPRTRWRRVALAGALVAGAGVAAVAIADAVRYRAIYAERMHASTSTSSGAPTPATTEEHVHGKEQ